jgi:hypothetical protein
MDLRSLDGATSYQLGDLPGRWRLAWADSSEGVFTSEIGRLLIPADRLSLGGRNRLDITLPSARRRRGLRSAMAG